MQGSAGPLCEEAKGGLGETSPSLGCRMGLEVMVGLSGLRSEVGRASHRKSGIPAQNQQEPWAREDTDSPGEMGHSID